MATIQANNLTHVEIEQTSQETINYDLIETLANLCDLSLDAASFLKGSLKSDYAYKDSVDKVTAKFPTLSIEYTNRLLRVASNPTLKAWLIANHDSNNDGQIGMNEIAAIQNAALADDITSLVESAEFPNLLALMPALKTLKGGSGLSGDINITANTQVTSVDMSGTKTVNIDGVSDKAALTTLKYGNPTEIIITNCPNLNI